MPKVTQVKADVPHELKCRVFSVLALRDQRFNRWVTDCMEAFLQQVESEQQTPRDAPLVASTTGTQD